MPSLATEELESRGVAGGDQHVVPTRRVVGEKGQDGAAAVGDELLADPWKQVVVPHARVFGALVLADVVRAEGKQVAALFPLDVDAAEALPGFQLNASSLPGRNVD